MPYSQLSIDLLDPYTQRLELLQELLQDEFASNEARKLALAVGQARAVMSLSGRVQAFIELVPTLQAIALSPTVPLRHRVRLSILREEALQLSDYCTSRLCELNTRVYDRALLLSDRSQVLRLAELRNRCFNDTESLDVLEAALVS
jgi:hypothetical protein